MILMIQVGSFALNSQLALDWARARNARRLVIEAPDGLKHVAVELARSLSAAGLEVLISGRHTWGGCDVGFREALSLGADGIIHLGHHGFVGFESADLPVLFLPVVSTTDPLPAFRKALEEALSSGYRRIAVGVTAQHLHVVDELEKEARALGAEPVMGFLGKFKGLVIGCSYSSLAEGDASVIVAGGVFHGLGAALWTGKPVWVADPFTGEAKLVSTRAVVARRLEALSRAIDAKKFAVVVSVKPGQRRLHVADVVVNALRKHGREAWITFFDDISREALVNLSGAEAFVNTACPRLVIDDPELFPGPAVNPGELKYVLKGVLEGYSPRDALFFDPRALAEA